MKLLLLSLSKRLCWVAVLWAALTSGLSHGEEYQERSEFDRMSDPYNFDIEYKNRVSKLSFEKQGDALQKLFLQRRRAEERGKASAQISRDSLVLMSALTVAVAGYWFAPQIMSGIVQMREIAFGYLQNAEYWLPGGGGLTASLRSWMGANEEVEPTSVILELQSQCGQCNLEQIWADPEVVTIISRGDKTDYKVKIQKKGRAAANNAMDLAIGKAQNFNFAAESSPINITLHVTQEQWERLKALGFFADLSKIRTKSKVSEWEKNIPLWGLYRMLTNKPKDIGDLDADVEKLTATVLTPMQKLVDKGVEKGKDAVAGIGKKVAEDIGLNKVAGGAAAYAAVRNSDIAFKVASAGFFIVWSLGSAAVAVVKGGAYIAGRPGSIWANRKILNDYKPRSHFEAVEVSYIRKKYVLDKTISTLIEHHLKICSFTPEHFAKTAWLMELAMNLPVAYFKPIHGDMDKFNHLFRNYAPSTRHDLEQFAKHQILEANYVKDDAKRIKALRAYFMGESGVGKTEAVDRMGRWLDVPIVRANFHDATVAELIGTTINSANPQPGRIIEAFVEASKKGPFVSFSNMIFVIEDFDTLTPDLHSFLLQMLDQKTDSFFSPFFNTNIRLPAIIILTGQKPMFSASADGRVKTIFFPALSSEQKKAIIFEDVLPQSISDLSLEALEIRQNGWLKAYRSSAFDPATLPPEFYEKVGEAIAESKEPGLRYLEKEVVEFLQDELERSGYINAGFGRTYRK